jgi:hypothetical protein
MANELTLNASLGYSKNAATVAEAVSALHATVTGNGLNSLTAYSAPTADTAIPLGSVTVAGGWLFVLNTDITNYVQLKTAVGGTLIAKMLPGEFVYFRMDPSITAPSLMAHTAPCVCKIAVFDL